MLAVLLAKASVRPLLRKVIGFSAVGLVLALVASVTALAVQTEKLGAARETLAAKEAYVGVLEERIESDQQLIAERDRLIDQQNEAVLALAQASKENRAAYLARVAAAETTANGYRQQADAILSQQLDTEDELERSRAALRLILDTIAQE